MASEFWDKRYGTEGFIYGTQPNAYLRSQAHHLRLGMAALAIADGEGRNGVWLAEQGLEVLSVDKSAVGLAKAAELARERGVCLTTLRTDLAEWGWRAGAFDLVISIFAHFRPATRQLINRRIVESLRPGGLVIVEAFHKRQLGRSSGGPKDLELLYEVDYLRTDFQSLDLIELLEGQAMLDEGPFHQGEAEVVRYIGRKPL